MTEEQLTEWINTGRELESTYQGKEYSIIYYNDDRKDYISFCEFYQDTLDVKDAQNLWNGVYHGMKVSDILESVPEDKVYVY